MNPDQFLPAIRERLGNPKRSLGLFKPSPLEFPEPPWLRNVSASDDQIKLIFHAFKHLWKHGVVVWGYVVRVNSQLRSPGTDDSPGTMIFSATDSDASAFENLPKLASRLWDLGESDKPSPEWTQKETEWWEDINDDLSYQKGVRLPAEWQPNGDYKGSSVLFHRGHLPGGYLQSRLLPILLDPLGNLLQIIPTSYWPEGMAEYLAGRFGFERSRDVGRAPDLLDSLAPDPVDSSDREAAYTEVFGPIVSVLHELVPRPDHIDVYTFGWPVPRSEHGYFSGGMSNLLQPGGGEFSRIELAFYSKYHDPRFAKLIQVFARYPWQTGSSLYPWDTVPLGHHAAAVLGTDRFPALVFFPGVARPESPVHQTPAFASRDIRFLTVVPLTQAELDYKLSAGTEEFIARIDEARLDMAFDPERPSLV